METSKPGSVNLAFKWAVIYAVISIVLTYVYQFLNIDMNSAVKYIGYLPFIGLLLLTQKEYRDKLGGFMTFGEGFLPGFLYSVFAGVILAVFMYLYFSFLSPQVWAQTLATTRETMVQQGTLSSDQVDKAMEMTTKYGVIFVVFGVIIGTPIMGAIVALIGAAIFKKERTLRDIEQADSTTLV
ncbi:DUF4199 domain-containing protein [Mucilaginibacter sp.]|uniref:DUF4199 domain-containing protein n=1 Tax=Mucilaginibacter sp. TaxID=1882438 RepID=UPI003D12E03B